VEIEERFDQQLKQLSVKDKKLKIMNTGLMGYGTNQELLYLIHNGLQFHQDMAFS
jgi:hypothetical protein